MKHHQTKINIVFLNDGLSVKFMYFFKKISATCVMRERKMRIMCLVPATLRAELQ